MRRGVVATIALVALAVLGVAALAVGIGLRTVWLPDDEVSAVATIEDPGVVLTTAPGLLEARPGPVTVTAETSDGGPVLLAVGRERDVEAYAQDLAGTTLTGFETESPTDLTTSTHGGAPPAEGAPTLPDPAGSDLWTQRETGTGSATLSYDPPEGAWLVLASGDGTTPAPDRVTITWPQEVRTPWATPLVVTGILLLLLAAAGLALRRWRAALLALFPRSTRPEDEA